MADNSGLQLETVAIAELHPHPRNYNVHPDDQIEHLIESIRANGIYRNIVIARDNTVLAGHGVVKAAGRMGITDIPVYRLDIGPDDPRALKVLAGDNEISHLSEKDDRNLADILHEIMTTDDLLGTGYDEMMLANLAYITRSELTTFNAAAEWVGLPEYAEGEEPYKVVVSLRNEQDRNDFLQLIGSPKKMSGNGNTSSVWWPEKKKDDFRSIRFEADPPVLPRYPIYIPSKGRYESGLTMKFLIRDRVPFYLVVEEQERDEYARRYGEECILVLPFVNQGLIAARNWIKQHATGKGYVRHWQLDDNIRDLKRRWKGFRVQCNAGIALRVVEDFVDRYENVAIAGLNYLMFVPDRGRLAPFYLNSRVYSCTLILNSLPNEWRQRYNDDTDMCLQVLADGWCTVLVNAFVCWKIRTMIVKGGNTADLYQGDGRLKMARSLERIWPGVVETHRRFRRPQHVVKDAWRRFNTPLKRKPDLVIDPTPNEYGMKLIQVASRIKSAELRELVKGYLVDEGSLR